MVKILNAEIIIDSNDIVTLESPGEMEIMHVWKTLKDIYGNDVQVDVYGLVEDDDIVDLVIASRKEEERTAC